MSVFLDQQDCCVSRKIGLAWFLHTNVVLFPRAGCHCSNLPTANIRGVGQFARTHSTMAAGLTETLMV
jgi:hypothetical protein